MSRPRQHVVMTADAVGGVWTYALDLAEGLIARGWTVDLAVLGPDPSADQERDARRRRLGLIATGLPLDWLAPDRVTLARAARDLAALSAEADIFHLNSPAFAADARFVAPVVGVCHSCLATWWAAAGAGAPPADFVWRTQALAQGYAACDALIAPSAAFAAATQAHYGVQPILVRNGRAGETDPLGGAREPIVITAGRLWDRGKNLAVLDAAAGLMRHEVQAAGDLTGPNGEAAPARWVRPLGRLESAALAQRLSRARVFASLAVYEPFGLGVLEAAQAGCALALSDIPTFRELWDGAALFIPHDDAGAAAAALDALVADPAACARLGEAAARRARAYSVEAMVEGVLAVYAQLQRRRRSEPSLAREAAA